MGTGLRMPNIFGGHELATDYTWKEASFGLEPIVPYTKVAGALRSGDAHSTPHGGQLLIGPAEAPALVKLMQSAVGNGVVVSIDVNLSPESDVPFVLSVLIEDKALSPERIFVAESKFFDQVEVKHPRLIGQIAIRHVWPDAKKAG